MWWWIFTHKWKHMLGLIISPREEIWVYTTSLNTFTFYWSACSKPEKWVVMFLCMLGILPLFLWCSYYIFILFFYNSMYLHQFLYMCVVVQFLFIYIEMVACYSSILPYVFIDHSQRCTLYKNKNVDIYFSPRNAFLQQPSSDTSNNLHQIHPTTFIRYIQQP